MNDRKRTLTTTTLLMLCLVVTIMAMETLFSSGSSPDQELAALQAMTWREAQIINGNRMNGPIEHSTIHQPQPNPVTTRSQGVTEPILVDKASPEDGNPVSSQGQDTEFAVGDRDGEAIDAAVRHDRAPQQDTYRESSESGQADLPESKRLALSGLTGVVAARNDREEMDFVTPHPVSGRDRNDVDAITPADCLARVRLLSDEIEAIRRIMGKPKTSVHGIIIEGAQPREVLYQVKTLYRKANLLAFENTRTSYNPPVTAPTVIRPMHVWKVLDASLRRVLHVKHQFGIVADVVEIQAPETTVPSDVFLSILETNRQLNSLLTKEFAPANVFQQVTVAVHHASRLLEQFDQSVATIEAPDFEEAKTPAQVYDRLLSCFHIIRRIGESSGVEVLNLTLTDGGIGNISPSDVYDIASLNVAELAFMHSRIPEAEAPERAYFPGFKFPSHVFQRAELLRRELETLERLAAANRNWMK